MSIAQENESLGQGVINTLPTPDPQHKLLILFSDLQFFMKTYRLGIEVMKENAGGFWWNAKCECWDD